MADGWIKFYRKTFDNPVVTKDPDHFMVWMYLLSEASHKDHPTMYGGKKITLKPGQLVTGRKKISDATGVNESKVKRILKLFKSDQQIDQQTNRYGSLISIRHWHKYQDTDQQNDQQVTNEWTTSDQQVTTKQECKELKNGKNINIIKDDIRGTDVPHRTIRQQVMDEWNKLPLQKVKAIKENTERAKLLKTRVNQYGLKSVLEAIQSIADSPYLLGQNRKGWMITFDWFVKPNNFIKVLEGNYIDKDVVEAKKDDGLDMLFGGN